MMTAWRVISRAVLGGLAALGFAVLLFMGACVMDVPASGLDVFLYGGILFAFAGFLVGAAVGALYSEPSLPRRG